MSHLVSTSAGISVFLEITIRENLRTQKITRKPKTEEVQFLTNEIKDVSVIQINFYIYRMLLLLEVIVCTNPRNYTVIIFFFFFKIVVLVTK